MDVFFMIFGFFVVFLCIAIMYFGFKKSKSDHTQPRPCFDSEFERVLKKKENPDKRTSIEERIETINKAEQDVNFNLCKSSEKKKSDSGTTELQKTKFPKKESRRASVFDDTMDKKKLPSDFDHNFQSKSHKNNGKIKAYRSSRSLVTVDKGKDNLLFQTIERMELEGMTVNEIAKKLGRGVREIEIIKRLNEKS